MRKTDGVLYCDLNGVPNGVLNGVLRGAVNERSKERRKERSFQYVGATSCQCVRRAVGGEKGSSLEARVAAVPAGEREKWVVYLERSARLQQGDRDTITAELRALGRKKMTPAPNVRASFTLKPYMRDEWFRSDSARRLAEAILSYQTPSGGWSKHVDFSAGPRPAGNELLRRE